MNVIFGVFVIGNAVIDHFRPSPLTDQDTTSFWNRVSGLLVGFVVCSVIGQAIDTGRRRLFHRAVKVLPSSHFLDNFFDCASFVLSWVAYASSCNHHHVEDVCADHTLRR
uniref:Uncharacterized protein n=1 Tax=Cryptomonas curvata TaxID=233186 RepID=A0A7S0MQF0_9CRYP|mmetsp:Transcript_51681/g.107975  ORF Transcript_51681/g.107975 Transcript_51681/m.107975 type:complete len:110 (+) Transcript_51681:176-505(+)